MIGEHSKILPLLRLVNAYIIAGDRHVHTTVVERHIIYVEVTVKLERFEFSLFSQVPQSNAVVGRRGQVVAVLGELEHSNRTGMTGECGDVVLLF